MKASWLLLSVLVISMAAAAPTPVYEVTLEHFRDLSFAPEDFSATCPGGAVRIDAGGAGFTFFEQNGQEGLPGGASDGYLDAGCGSMRKDLVVPAGAESMDITFLANRLVERAPGAPDVRVFQELRLVDADGQLLQEHWVFTPGSDSIETMQPVRISAFDVAGLDHAAIDWYFEDPRTASVDQGLQVPADASGQRFEASVLDAVASFEVRAPADGYAAATDEHRIGTAITTETRVTVSVETADHAVHVAVPAGLDLVRVTGPLGDMGTPGTFDGEGLRGHGQEGILLDLGPEQTFVTIPDVLVAQHGAGDYVFVFQEGADLVVSQALVPLTIVLLVAPLPFALLAFVEARAFRREAFGRYARSAGAMQAGVVLVALYYLAVVLSAVAGGRLDLMAVFPMPLEGILLYVQVVLAGIAFLVLWRVARELYRIVRPRRRGAEPALDDAL